MSVNWMRCAQEAGAVEMQDHASRGLSFLKRQQRLDHHDDVVRGGIAGSAPIWGAYSRFEFPNWAAKFFADALMMARTRSPIPPVLERLAAGQETPVHV
jgi:hypothetical protein